MWDQGEWEGCSGRNGCSAWGPGRAPKRRHHFSWAFQHEWALPRWSEPQEERTAGGLCQWPLHFSWPNSGLPCKTMTQTGLARYQVRKWNPPSTPFSVSNHAKKTGEGKNWTVMQWMIQTSLTRQNMNLDLWTFVKLQEGLHIHV